MRRPRGPALALLLVAAVAAGCELFTHALDYRVDPVLPLCDACPASRWPLRHPPCPVADPAPDRPGAVVFAARRAVFGHPGDLTPAFALGFDLDCSARPYRGLPVLCAPRSRDGWASLPGGIDDAFLQRVLVPVYLATPPSRAFDLDAALSGIFEQGRFGLVVSVDRWNGQPDDPDVGVTLRASPGLAGGGSPAWDGADVWASLPDVSADGTSPFHLDGLPAYVAGGTLVADARALGPAVYHFGLPVAGFDVILADLSFAGALGPGGLTRFTMTGKMDLPSARDAAVGFAGALTCDTVASVFFAAMPAQMPDAADLPMVTASPPADPCDAISFAWSFDAEPARLGAVVDPAAGPGGGPGACP